VLIGDIAVGKHAIVDFEFADEFRKIGFGVDRDAFG